LAIVAFLILVNAFFVAGEFSLVTVERSRVIRRAEEGDPRARRILAGLGKLSFHLSGAQLGITVSSLVLGLLAEQTLGPVIRPALVAVNLSPNLVPAFTVGLALAVATSLQLVFGELVPKNLAITYPYRTALRIGVPMLLVDDLLSPVIRVLNAAADRTVRLLGIEPREELAGVRSIEELELIIRASGERGVLTDEEFGLLTRSIIFTENLTTDVMIPRVQVVGLPATATVGDLKRASVESGHSRFPVYGVDLDDILGVAHVKDSLRVPAARRDSEPITHHMRPALIIPDTQRLDTVLFELRTRGSGMAVVKDEYGGTAGIVTSEDLLEEIVGEIRDEYDMDLGPSPRRRGELSGLLHRHEVEEEIGFLWPEGRYETLGGLITAELGRHPKMGDRVEIGDWRFEVIALDDFRVDRVKATPLRRAR
ncbi:MAG: hemolysin family protein, partial [Acidimicrobiia bacterium]